MGLMCLLTIFLLIIFVMSAIFSILFFFQVDICFLIHMCILLCSFYYTLSHLLFLGIPCSSIVICLLIGIPYLLVSRDVYFNRV